MDEPAEGGRPVAGRPAAEQPPGEQAAAERSAGGPPPGGEPTMQSERTRGFAGLVWRLRTAAGVLAVAALIGVVTDGLLHGLTFTVMAVWATLLVVAVLVATAVVVAVDAYRRAHDARAGGERLSGGDVGLWPARQGSDRS